MKKKYTIIDLLTKQPVIIKKSIDYINLFETIKNEKIIHTNISYRIYQNLNKCQIDSNSLSFYLKINNLPLHPFFPRFLLIKKRYIDLQNKRKNEKKEKIDVQMKMIDPLVKKYLKHYLEYEKKISSNQPALFFTIIIPKNLKKARIVSNYSLTQWYFLIDSYLIQLNETYKRTDLHSLTLLNYKMVLHFNPDETLTNEITSSAYRKLSLIYHPDKGGSQESFVLISEARKKLTT